LLLLIASASICVAGVVLNDVYDLQIDSGQRPQRPLPSGRIGVGAAQRFAWVLLFVGVASALATSFLIGKIGPGLVAGVLVLCVWLYDAGLKTTWFGPLLMGACRMLNVLFGMSVAQASFAAEHWAVASGVGLYVVGVTCFARGETEGGKRIALTLSSLVMLLGIGLLGTLPLLSDRLILQLQWEPGRWYAVIFILELMFGWRCLRAIIVPIPTRIQSVVAQSI
ncbi:MAG: UbiA family prenyltransferase, partial [Thermoguttaceae bacterium]